MSAASAPATWMSASTAGTDLPSTRKVKSMDIYDEPWLPDYPSPCDPWPCDPSPWEDSLGSLCP